MNTTQLIKNLRQCQACKLAKVRRIVVVGRGSIPAQVLIIGEAPGKSEDLLGEAFIGQAGKLLDRMLLDAGFTSDIRVFRTNTVLCHPCDKKGGDNREPQHDEVLCCMENIQSIIEHVGASTVILTGEVARKYYGKIFPQAFYIQHPSFLLRTGGIGSPYYLKNIRTLEEAYGSAQE